MEAYQQRVIDESSDLGTKIEKLREFLCTSAYENLNRVSRELLLLQFAYMQNYADVLAKRIALF